MWKSLPLQFSGSYFNSGENQISLLEDSAAASFKFFYDSIIVISIYPYLICIEDTLIFYMFHLNV